MDWTNLILLALLTLGIVSNNPAVSISVGLLLMIRLLHVERIFPFLEQYGLQVGIIILTIGVLAPVASGRIQPEAMGQAFLHWQSLLAIAVGIFVAYLGGRGAALMASNPLIVTGLLIGTILGVAFFRGVPVGPLIAAGIMSVLLSGLPK
ncbi:DUF441 domain-containing protein [Brevibacillus dissolubilis]|uniref:DUF441 domain-containing protein n=1 Tax=Brevibacillus dissolubilis TaxID=1844116 RepID=UPI00111651D6|nr:DUF441 domain-containing protein [Brevibacillus dissolubilis]